MRTQCHIELTDCAELDELDRPCLAPATIERLPPMTSTDGPIEFVATRCVFGHVLRMPTSMLVQAA